MPLLFTGVRWAPPEVVPPPLRQGQEIGKGVAQFR